MDTFGVSLRELKELMGKRKEEGRANVEALGGVHAICAKLNTSPENGLKGEEKDIQKRKDIYGSNFIPPAPSKSFFALVWEALQDTTLIILQVAALISLVLWAYERKHNAEAIVESEEEQYGWIEGAAILFSVFIVVLVTAFNDYAKERQFQKLQ
jgi:Ca2+ transporting ATPase